MKLYFTMLFIMLSALLFSATYTVKQDGTGDYTQIQQAIDAAIDNDIVLVNQEYIMKISPFRERTLRLHRWNTQPVMKVTFRKLLLTTNRKKDQKSAILNRNPLKIKSKVSQNTQKSARI